jgi:hypothetical protein
VSIPKDFTITSFPWRREIAERLRSAGHTAPDDPAILDTLTALARFLESHNLVTRPILFDGILRDGRQFTLRSSDLNEQGLAVIRAGFGKWENQGCPADNLQPLETALARIVKQAGSSKLSSKRADDSASE